MAGKPRFVSLYTGAGGLDLGFIAAGFTPVFANDINADAMETYAATMDMISERTGSRFEHDIVMGDIRQVETLPAKGCAELVIGGPPCQGFSVAGKMDPNDPRSRHVFDFLAMVERIEPAAFVMENVKALAKNERWAYTIADIRKQAEKIGYKTFLEVLNSADFGVSQTRERMFLVGVRDESAEYAFPRPSAAAHISVAEALRGLPRYGLPGNDGVCRAKVVPCKTPVLRQSPFAGMLFNGQGRPMDMAKPAPTLPATMGGNRTPIVDQEALENDCEQWAVAYHARLSEGGKTVPTVPERMRRITVQEAAAIQSFPKDMPWHGSQSSRYRQIGNAVPPKLAYAVARSLDKALGFGAEPNESLISRLLPPKRL